MNPYCEYVASQFQNFGFYADVDTSSKTMNKKVREAQVAQYNYVAVCGEKERDNLSVNLRDRDTGRSIGELGLAAACAMFEKMANPNSKPAKVLEAFEGSTPSLEKEVVVEEA